MSAPHRAPGAPAAARVIERAQIMHDAKRTGDIDLMRNTAQLLHDTFPNVPRPEETPR
ncbi:hypothetical protein OG618_37740 (plasmid) [Kitasatospora sp. NBC_01246]|uniref:hypothetical protein n=1 Tax=Kitasatospora sp. NBC_01246 TaxID=2903570 RepID=UPI002E2F319E|nr:hypothetical protein [Kitasatospora sp. NBC_01246]